MDAGLKENLQDGEWEWQHLEKSESLKRITINRSRFWTFKQSQYTSHISAQYNVKTATQEKKNIKIVIIMNKSSRNHENNDYEAFSRTYTTHKKLGVSTLCWIHAKLWNWFTYQWKSGKEVKHFGRNNDFCLKKSADLMNKFGYSIVFCAGQRFDFPPEPKHLELTQSSDSWRDFGR